MQKKLEEIALKCLNKCHFLLLPVFQHSHITESIQENCIFVQRMLFLQHMQDRNWNWSCTELWKMFPHPKLWHVFPQRLLEHTRSAVKQNPTSFGVAGFPTVLAVAGIPTMFVVAMLPTTSLVGRLPQQRLWEWHTIGNLASKSDILLLIFWLKMSILHSPNISYRY